MPMFLVQHKHDAATCPAANKEVAPQLLQLLDHAGQAGLTIHGEAVIDGEHELNMIVEAATAAAIEQYLAPFGQMGSLTVRGGSVCKDVVARGFC